MLRDVTVWGIIAAGLRVWPFIMSSERIFVFFYEGIILRFLAIIVKHRPWLNRLNFIHLWVKIGRLACLIHLLGLVVLLILVKVNASVLPIPSVATAHSLIFPGRLLSSCMVKLFVVKLDLHHLLHFVEDLYLFSRSLGLILLSSLTLVLS